MVQVGDSLDSLNGGEGFSLQSSDGRFNSGLAYGLQALGVAVQPAGLLPGLTNSFGLAVAGPALPVAAPESLPAPQVRLNPSPGV